jgi:Transglutaminase-like superfamily
MTAIDHGSHSWALEGLPADPASLAATVRGVLIHRDWAPLLGVQFEEDRLADQHLRSTREVMARILELSPQPVRVERSLPDRMVGVCRHFATLYVSLLRENGIPARARAGFARYFGDGWSDHWITERWDGRWVRHDAQIGPVARASLGLTFDPADQPPGEFLTGAEAWLRCRAGDEDPAQFGIFDEHGLWFVEGDLLLDLAALNGVELLPWDTWGAAHGPGWTPTNDEAAVVDELADLIYRDDVAEIRDRYTQPGLRVPPNIFSFVDGVRRPVALEPELVSVP